MRQKYQNPNIDRNWFQLRMDERELSIRKLASMIGKDPTSTSFMLRGIRRITGEEAVQLGDIFNVSAEEILRRAGAPIADRVRTLPVSAYIDSSDKFHEIPVEAQDQFSAPHDCPSNSYVIQMRNGSLYDGWMIVVNGLKREPDDCLGKFALLCASDGKRYIGFMRRGYKAGTFNFTQVPFDHGKAYENIDILWASEVLWVKPPLL